MLYLSLRNRAERGTRQYTDLALLLSHFPTAVLNKQCYSLEVPIPSQCNRTKDTRVYGKWAVNLEAKRSDGDEAD